MKFLLLIAKNLRRNLLRSMLTAAGHDGPGAGGDAGLVGPQVSRPGDRREEQELQGHRHRALADPQPDAVRLRRSRSAKGPRARPGDVRPIDSMTWQFYGGTLDPANRTRENMLFFFAMDPRKSATMMDDLDTLPPRAELKQLDGRGQKLENNRRGLLIGPRPAGGDQQAGRRAHQAVSASTTRTSTWNSRSSACCRRAATTRAPFMNRDYLNDAAGRLPATHQRAEASAGGQDA